MLGHPSAKPVASNEKNLKNKESYLWMDLESTWIYFVNCNPFCSATIAVTMQDN